MSAEADVGINEYVSSGLQGFNAVIKHRWGPRKAIYGLTCDCGRGSTVYYCPVYVPH